MSNPLFNELNSGNNNVFNMVKQFNEFRKNITNTDAQAQVQNLLNSGKMTQSQYNKLQNMATMFSKFIK